MAVSSHDCCARGKYHRIYSCSRFWVRGNSGFIANIATRLCQMNAAKGGQIRVFLSTFANPGVSVVEAQLSDLKRVGFDAIDHAMLVGDSA